jgi:hypothetical protein
MVTVTITITIIIIIIITIVFLETAVCCFITHRWLIVGNDSFEELPTSTFRVVQELFGSRKLVATFFLPCLSGDESSTPLRNLGYILPINTASYPKEVYLFFSSIEKASNNTIVYVVPN